MQSLDASGLRIGTVRVIAAARVLVEFGGLRGGCKGPRGGATSSSVGSCVVPFKLVDDRLQDGFGLGSRIGMWMGFSGRGVAVGFLLTVHLLSACDSSGRGSAPARGRTAEVNEKGWNRAARDGHWQRYTVLNMSIQKTLPGFGWAESAWLWPGLCLVWLQAQQPPKQPLNVQKVTDNLWVIMSSDSGNVAVMPTGEGVLLVDDKFDQYGADILAKVKAVSDKPIKYILNTHQHGDHTGGNAFMLMNTPAEILIHKNARANMVAGKQPGLPQVTFADEAQVFIGGKEVSAHHLGRGHTNGDAVILFPSERVLHTGDLFVNGSAPFIDYSAKGSIVEWDKTLDRVLQLDFDIVIPGHGPVAKKADLVKWRDSIAELRVADEEGLRRWRGGCGQTAGFIRA